jgi:8-amino-7-oxononanoate synthase
MNPQENWQLHVEKILSERRKHHLWRQPQPRNNCQGRVLHTEGQELINFASNDYLGLASDPRIANAALESSRIYGFGSGGSRLLGGDLELFHEFESELAHRHGLDQACTFNSGYQANVGLVQTLSNLGFTLVIDRLAHASIWDGVQSSKAKFLRFRHND